MEYSRAEYFLDDPYFAENPKVIDIKNNIIQNAIKYAKYQSKYINSKFKIFNQFIHRENIDGNIIFILTNQIIILK